jgi:hypothetical protein
MCGLRRITRGDAPSGRWRENLGIGDPRRVADSVDEIMAATDGERRERDAISLIHLPVASTAGAFTISPSGTLSNLAEISMARSQTVPLAARKGEQDS